VEGVKTSVPLQRKIMDDPDFQAGRVDTSFLNRYQQPKRNSAAS
jgi:acetyl-CoA carboxylase biotin carboxylase subunit